MITGAIHPSTSRAAHAGAPPGSADEHIAALRRHAAEVADWQRIAEIAQAEAIEARNLLREVQAERDAALRENRGLARVLDGMQAHVDETNHENRVLRGLREDDRTLIADLQARLAAAESELDRRGRHRRSR
ncbi:hypothetical protein [Actinocrinis sp.]|uniref:hypothetical protein n=1 Tax=Actinocrinis sp. TaxID=1920516 RepID=UPI002D596E0C|nr:hypothetical protein [Actinocrinis sp.]HZP55001.1 hypothetical protein [Actinocrinis sp.]